MEAEMGWGFLTLTTNDGTGKSKGLIMAIMEQFVSS